MDNSALSAFAAALLGGQAPLPGSNPAPPRKLVVAPTRHTPKRATRAKLPQKTKDKEKKPVSQGA